MSQEWSLTPTAPPPVKGKAAIWTGAILLVLGIVVAVVGIVGAVGSIGRLVSGGYDAPQSTPTTLTRTLDGGTTYDVYELVTSGSGTAGDPIIANVSVDDVVVSGPRGPVPVRDPGRMTQTLTLNSRTYAAVATFDPPVSGSYSIMITTDGAEVLVAPALSTIGKSFAWFATIGLGGLVALVGLVVLIVGLVRRSSSRRPPAMAGYGAPGTTYPQYGDAQQYGGAPPYTGQPAAPVQPPTPAPAMSPPPGWYPDPGRPGGQRYWDGAAWTEHTA